MSLHVTINVRANRAVVRVRQFSSLRKAVYIRKLEYLTYHLLGEIWKLIYFLPKYVCEALAMLNHYKVTFRSLSCNTRKLSVCHSAFVFHCRWMGARCKATRTIRPLRCYGVLARLSSCVLRGTCVAPSLSSYSKPLPTAS